jgi:hypothetical protein
LLKGKNPANIEKKRDENRQVIYKSVLMLMELHVIIPMENHESNRYAMEKR